MREGAQLPGSKVSAGSKVSQQVLSASSRQTGRLLASAS
jgi:hypothetical protein